MLGRFGLGKGISSSRSRRLVKVGSSSRGEIRLDSNGSDPGGEETSHEVSEAEKSSLTGSMTGEKGVGGRGGEPERRAIMEELQEYCRSERGVLWNGSSS